MGIRSIKKGAFHMKYSSLSKADKTGGSVLFRLLNHPETSSPGSTFTGLLDVQLG